MTRTIRVGIVNYLNSRPLAWSFLRGRVDAALRSLFLPPARVSEALSTGDVEVGLIPSIDLQRIRNLRVLPGLCVAATREVRSVLLLSRRPFGQIERLALDANSRTSAILVQIVLRELYGIEPRCRSMRPDLAAMMDLADAALVIGDPALQVDRHGYHVLDLAAAWHRLTGLPFVFAVWAVRDGVDLGSHEGVFHRSLEHGLAEMELLVREAAAEMKLPLRTVHEYLTSCLSFELGAAERSGLEEFHRRAAAHGLLDELRSIEIEGCCDPAGDSVE